MGSAGSANRVGNPGGSDQRMLPGTRRSLQPGAPEIDHAFRLAIENAIPTGIAACDLEGRQSYVNPSFCRMVGWSREELLGACPPYVYWPEEEIARISDALDATTKGLAPPGGFELRFRRRSGERFDVRLTVSPLENASGERFGWLASVEDLTDSRHAARRIEQLNQELQRRVREFEALLEVLPVGIGVAVDPECRDIRINPAFARMLGIPTYINASKTGPQRDELLFKVYRDGKEVPGEDLPMQVAAREGVEVRDFELEYFRADGSQASVFGYACPLFDENGKTRGSLGAFIDITERKMAERALREGEARFRELADAMPQMVWTARPDGYLDYYNRRWYEFTGFPEGLGGDESWKPILHPDDVQLCMDTWYKAVRTGLPYQIEYRFFDRKSGTYLWHLGRALPVRDEAGHVVRWYGTCTDIDDQKRAEETARQKQKLESVGLLAGGIAHDFNNLLTGIMGNASLVLDLLPTDDPGRPFLEDVVSASEKAADLTRQLLAYAGKGRFVIRPIDLSDMVREISGLVQVSIPKKVELELNLATDLPAVEADPGQIQQVVMNLVINAAEAIGESTRGTVLVRTDAVVMTEEELRRFIGFEETRPGCFVRLTVSDTGSGMDEATISRIFDPFFTTKFTGRGLGLSAVFGVVRGHKGALRVESSPAKGSTFEILLPASGEPIRAQTPLTGQTGELRGTGTILVVDDEEIVRQTTRHALEHYGYSVISASDGLEAIRALEQGVRPEAVLLDLSMPVMSGEDALPEILRLRPGIPVLLSSGYNEGEATRRFGTQGWSGFLHKPYSAADLARKIKSVLR